MLKENHKVELFHFLQPMNIDENIAVSSENTYMFELSEYESLVVYFLNHLTIWI